MPFERELAAVQEWFSATDEVARVAFERGARAELKADGTPVTETDRAIERMLRDAIELSFPGDAVLGEEQGAAGDAARRWIIDPIDGTKNFARGVPVYATLVGLEVDGEAVLGAVSAPSLGGRWWATRGGGAFRDGRPITVSAVARLDEAQICSGDVVRYGGDRVARFVDLCARSARFRAFGDFWGHVLVAQGSMEVMVEFADLSPWDLVPVAAIVREAGGVVTGLDGSRDVRSGPVVTSNALVHDDVIALLKP